MNAWKFALVICCLLGCSKADGPDRYHVSGTVTFQGNPVPMGVIYFEPDHDAGNSGPQGFAEIIGGRFDTNSKTGRGIVSGPAVITITGQKQHSTNAEQVGETLFEDYVIRQEFEPKNNTVDFDVPPEAAKTRK